ncbi:hypothetical protein LCGC14_1157170 [marine sediment metagenome]|uniref:Uncharacterized protein n=1 Tax=marine sediment metagenome TaxID=412755 RepID=A0A0F9LYP5_9ZZZZ
MKELKPGWLARGLQSAKEEIEANPCLQRKIERCCEDFKISPIEIASDADRNGS